MKVLLLLAWLPVIFLPACSSFSPGIEGHASVSAEIPCRDFAPIADTLDSLLAGEGYKAVSDQNAQTPIYGSPPRFRLGYEFRNGRRIWFVAQPRPAGWLIQAFPEPTGTDTWFPRRQISTILETLQSRCAAASSAPGTPFIPTRPPLVENGLPPRGG